MKHVVEVTFNFTVEAPPGSDAQEIEREVAAAARHALDAGMASIGSGDRLGNKLVAGRSHNVTASGLQDLWRWSGEIPRSLESTLVRLLVVTTLRDRHEVLTPDQQQLLDTAANEVDKMGDRR